MGEADLFQKVIKKYGVLNQSLKCLEELSELALALNASLQNFLNPVNGRGANVGEEIADVQIMLDQMKIIYPEWMNWHGKKLLRLQSMVVEEERIS